MIIRSHGLSTKTSKRAQLLASAGAAVLVTISAISAQAATVTVQTNPDAALALGGLANAINSTNTGVVRAIVDSTDGTIGSGTSTGGSNSVNANTAAARAIGNATSNSVNQLNILAGPVNGVGAATLAINTGLVSSEAQGNALAVQIGAITSGTAANVGNTVSADTTANRSVTAITSVAPSSAPAPTVGSATFDAASVVSDSMAVAIGDIVASSVQSNTPAGTAAVQNNRVGLDLGFDLAADPVVIGVTLDANTIAATYKANSASTTAAVTAAGVPNFGGSIVVSNAQTNAGPASPVSATNRSALIDANLGYVVPSQLSVNGGSLAGSLSIGGNAVTAAATGNDATGTGIAGNRIVIADGVSVHGAGGLNSGSSASVSGSDAALAATADLVVLSSQRNDSASIAAATTDGFILANVRSLIGGTVAVGGNTFSAAAAGNLASSAVLSGTGAATFDATVAVLNHQANTGGGTSARSAGNVTIANVGQTGFNPGLGAYLFDHANLSLVGDTDRATASGNTSTQRVAIDATTVAPTAASFAQGSAGDVHGGVTVSNTQLNTNAPTSAEVSRSSVGASSLVADTLNSRIAVSSNTQEAIAIANSAASDISLIGTTVGSGAGILNIQTNDVASATTSSLAAEALISTRNTSGSTLALTDNVQRGIAYGNSATSTVGVSATQVTSLSGPAEGATSVPVAFGAVNSQTQRGDVTATARGFDGILIGDLGQTAVNLVNFNADNSRNALVAAAYGNEASTATVLTIGSIVSGGQGGQGTLNVASLTSGQDGTGAISAGITGGQAIATSVFGDVVSSPLTVGGNSIQALAYGNKVSSNALTVSGTDITTVPNGSGQPSSYLYNQQFLGGSVAAAQRDGADAASIGASVTGSVNNSAVLLASNISTTLATGNAAVNRLSLTATTLKTTAGLKNVQTASAQISAKAGLAGIPANGGSAAIPFNYDASSPAPPLLTATVVGQNVTLTGGTLQVAIATLTPAESSALQGQGWTVSGTNLVISAVVLGTIPLADYEKLAGGATRSLPATIPAIPATAGQPALGGVNVALGAGIFGSSIKVADNAASTGAVINNAVNTLSATATQLHGVDLLGLPLKLTNSQAATAGASATAEIYGAFSITGTDKTVIGTSSLEISGNSQVANALGNVGANALIVTATGMDASLLGPAPGASIVSAQSAGATISALSELVLAAPVSALGSSVAITGNRDTALAVVNDVTNTLSVAATNIGGNTSSAFVTGGSSVASADHFTDSTQSASGTLAATATTRIANNDTLAANVGVSNGSVAITGNVTTAEASANRALNSVSVIGAASQSASAALANRQDSSTAVSAVATTVADVGLASTTLALNAGNVALNGNVTTALARGNAATNALTVTSSSPVLERPYGASGSPVSAVAPAVALNTQTNSGNVASTASGTYSVALNAGNAGSSSMRVGNNLVSAAAYGNTATNSLQVTALNGSSPAAAVANYQVNSGAISATAQNVTFGALAPAQAANSSFGVGGNQVTATAVGNSVVTTLTSGR